jgi:NADPH:quinone reductase-like Zn-dependent oxidoreductase
MQAVVFHEYGPPDVLHLEEVNKPTPKDDEILIKVNATAVTIGDLWARNFRAIGPSEFTMPLLLWLASRLYFGVTRPRITILGSEFAGQVEAVGKQVKRLRAGDPVFGYRGQSMGANAEYLCMAEAGVVALKPVNLSYEEAAAVPYGALVALSLLRKVNLEQGQKLLIIGASGSIGAAAVQLAKHFGAEVTGVCSSRGLEFVKSLGADHVIDYTREDFTRSGETYDLVFDILGKSSFARCKRALKPQGTYLLASFKLRQLLQMMWTGITGGRRVVCALASERVEDLVVIKELVEAGKLKSIVDRCYPLDQVADAHRYLERRLQRGHVVIRVSGAESVATAP